MTGPYYTEDHDAFRAMVRRFVATEIEPFAADWEEEGGFPRALYEKAGAAGLLGLGLPEAHGGVTVDRLFYIILAEELARAAAGGVAASLMSSTIGAPPIARLGSPALQARVLPAIIAGQKISALAITEPSGGSDVRAIRTRAVRDGTVFRVTGEKTFITSGMRADYYTVAVRTGGPGMNGLSLLLIERDAPGFTRTPLKKMGWWASDTATLHFDDTPVPADNLLGPEGEGFRAIMENFNGERLWMAAQCASAAQVCLEESVTWARDRQVFGGPLIASQVIRHKLVDMATRIEATKALVDLLAWRMTQGENPVAEIAMAKNQATQTLAFCASEAVQIHGGMGYMRGMKVERIYRDVKVNAIGGGAEEVMKDLAARQRGWG